MDLLITKDKVNMLGKIIFKSFTDPILIYDFAQFFCDGTIPRSFIIVLEDSDKSKVELEMFLKNYKVLGDDMIEIEPNLKLTVLVDDKNLKCKYLLHKNSPQIKRAKIYVCETRNCKNPSIQFKSFCKEHICQIL